MIAGIQNSATESGSRMRSETPVVTNGSPHQTIAQSTTKSWCSSPFSNLVALSPDGNSLSFQLDFSPSITFSASACKYPIEQGSPQSGMKHQRDPYGNIFSPSLFSPFNKTLKAHKMDKGLEGEYMENDIPNCESKNAFSPNSKNVNLFKKHMTSYEPDFELMNFAQSPQLYPTTYTTFHINDSSASTGYTDGKNKLDQDDPSESVNMNMSGSLMEFSPPGIERRKEDRGSGSGGGGGIKGGVVPPLSGKIRTPLSQHLTSQSSTSSSSNAVSSNNTSFSLQALSKGDDAMINSTSGSLLNYHLTHSNASGDYSNSSRIQGNNSSSTPSKKALLFSSPVDVLVRSKHGPTNISPNFPPVIEFISEKSQCNCKKSKCLKLYCECFAALKYCSGCNCLECNNCKEYEDVRHAAIASTKERNKDAFQLKVNPKKGQHLSGCNCKKSKCLKKYCECFEGEVFCSDSCKCVSCLNTEEEAIKAGGSFPGDSRERVSSAVPSVMEYSPENVNSATNISALSVGGIATPMPCTLDGNQLNSMKKRARHSTPQNSSIGNSMGGENNIHKLFRLAEKSMRCGSGSGNGGGEVGLMDEEDENGYEDGSEEQEMERNGGGEMCGNEDGDGDDSSRSVMCSREEHNKIRRLNANEGNMNDALSVSCNSNSVNNSPDSVLHHQQYKRLHHSYSSSCTSSPGSEAGVIDPVYDFFGGGAPSLTKITALRCLEYLDGKSLYSVSLVNRLWSRAAMDDALWE